MSGSYEYSDLGPYAIIPEWIGYHPDLSDRAVRVFFILARHANADTGEAWPSRKTMAAIVRSSVDSVDRALSELEALEILERRPRYVDGRQSSNLYRLHFSAPMRPGVGTGAEGEVGTGTQVGVGTGAVQKESQEELEPVEPSGELPLSVEDECARDVPHETSDGAQVSARRPERAEVVKDRSAAGRALRDAGGGRKQTRRTDPRADGLVREWWEAQPSSPNQGWPAAVGVVSKALRNGVSEDRLRAALRTLDSPLSGGRLDYALGRLGRSEPGQSAGLSDAERRAMPTGPVDLRREAGQ